MRGTVCLFLYKFIFADNESVRIFVYRVKKTFANNGVQSAFIPIIDTPLRIRCTDNFLTPIYRYPIYSGFPAVVQVSGVIK